MTILGLVALITIIGGAIYFSFPPEDPEIIAARKKYGKL